MDVSEFVPPLPLEPPDDETPGSGKCKAPPPPPLQTSSDAEEMDVSSGGDGPSLAPAEDTDVPLLTKGSASFSGRALHADSCPGTGRHAPPVTSFLPDLRLLRDVKISVSFGGDGGGGGGGGGGGSVSSKGKDRKVLYTGQGQIDEQQLENGEAMGSAGEGTVQGDAGVEPEAEQENKVEFAVLDELEDFSENFLDAEDGEESEYTSEMIVQQQQANDEDHVYSYEVHGASRFVFIQRNQFKHRTKSKRLAFLSVPRDVRFCKLHARMCRVSIFFSFVRRSTVATRYYVLNMFFVFSLILFLKFVFLWGLFSPFLCITVSRMRYCHLEVTLTSRARHRL